MNISESTLKRRIAETKGKHYYKAKGRPEVAFSFLFLCFTGLRMGEASKLAWKDVMDDRINNQGNQNIVCISLPSVIPSVKRIIEFNERTSRSCKR